MRRGLLLPLTLIPIAALVVVLPLVMHGCSCGHDFDFHLVSWFEAAAQFRAGVWHPSWAFSPAWNAGEPRFVFYPPLSWTVGALLGMVLPWGAVPVVYTWLAIAAAGLAMYRLARELEASEAGAMVAAAAYMANPYMMFTAYERTAYAELLAAAWIPLLLAAVLRERVTVMRVAVPVALLWLTNAPAAVMGCYALAVVAAVRLVLMVRRSDSKDGGMRERWMLTGRVSAGVALGLGLAAFYVVPAAYERRWVQIKMAMVEGMRFGDNFLFHHTSDALHDEVLHTASMIAVGMMVAAVVVLILAVVVLRSEASHVSEARRGAPGFIGVRKRVVISIAVLVVVIAVLLTPVSGVVWRVAPEMAFLQFPWRWVAVLSAAVCAGIALAAERVRVRPVWLCVGAVVMAAAIGWPSVHQFREECDDEDTVQARLAVFEAKTGTDATDEYTTGEADNDALLHADSAYWLSEDGDGRAPQSGKGLVPMHFAVDAGKAETLVMNLREYPAWRVRVNGTEVKERVARADGLIALPVGVGRSRVDVDYEMTSDRWVGDGVSLVALCLAIGFVGWKRRDADPSTAR